MIFLPSTRITQKMGYDPSKIKILPKTAVCNAPINVISSKNYHIGPTPIELMHPKKICAL